MTIQGTIEKPGEMLRTKRIESNMSQERVAEAIGVSMSSVNRWERGTRSPQPAEASHLQDLFGIPATAWNNSLPYKLAMAFRKISKHFGTSAKPAHFAVCAAIISTESNFVLSSDPEYIAQAFGGVVTASDVSTITAQLVAAGVFVRRDNGYTLSV